MRPRGRRRIKHNFNDNYFKPRGVPLNLLTNIDISYEELETIRLRYIEKLSQNDAAKEMGISQSQYQRDLYKTLEKITIALTNGYAINIEKDIAKEN